MDALRLDNSILGFDGVARCRMCGEWDEIGILFPMRIFHDGDVTTNYAHIGCLVS